MIFNRLLAILVISSIFISSFAKADVSAEVDRTEMALGETIDLTITSDGSDTPDLEPLKKLFSIVSVQQRNEISYINGKTSSLSRWIISITPKQSADAIIIPPINLGSEQTKPINIKLVATPKNIKSMDGKDVLKAEISFDTPTAYIQQQIILTLRIYVNEQKVVESGNLVAPTLPEFSVKQLKDNQYSKNINGIPYTVVERRYALSAQKSGDIKIPPFTLSARIINNQNRAQTQTVASNELLLKVRPKPTNYPANTPWLPAKNISLTEQWNKNIDNVLQGETLTRSINLSVMGLTSQQISPLPTQTIIGMRSYPDQPKLTDKWQQNLPVGSREEQQVLIPIKTGEITVPEIKLAWWNIDKDQLEYATLPAHKMVVTANPAYNNSPTPFSSNNSTEQTTSTSSLKTPSTSVAKVTNSELWLWQLATLVLTITTLLGFGLWLYARRQPAIIKEQPSVINPKTLLDDIKKACQDNDPQATRIALDNWAKQQPENLTDIVARHMPLAVAMEELNKALYSETETIPAWKGDQLWQAIQSLPKQELMSNTANSTLPPLYPK